MRTFLSSNTQETVCLGERLGRLLLPGDFVALVGDLGSGKTHFVQGIALAGSVCHLMSAFPARRTPCSTSMPGAYPCTISIFYRLDGDADIRDLGFEEYFYGRGACVVEWADRLSAELPEEHLRIVFTHEGETDRGMVLSAAGSRYRDLLLELLPEAEKTV